MWRRSRAPAALLVVLFILVCPDGGEAQGPLFTPAFPAEEFAERRARVMDRIGDDVAIIQGAAEFPAFVKFRQGTQFFYLTGVEVLRAILVTDGRPKQSTLYLAFYPHYHADQSRLEDGDLVPTTTRRSLTTTRSTSPASSPPTRTPGGTHAINATFRHCPPADAPSLG